MTQKEMQLLIATFLHKEQGGPSLARDVADGCGFDHKKTAHYDALKKMYDAGEVEKIDFKYVISELGIINYGLRSALAQTQKTPVSELKAHAVVDAQKTKSNTVEKIDEIEAKPYPFVTDSVIEDFETRVITPIGAKTVNEIKQHVNYDATTPSHYKGKTIQVFDVLDEFLTPEAVTGFHVGNVVKYVLRYKHKNGREDLLKARAYLDKLIGEAK